MQILLADDRRAIHPCKNSGKKIISGLPSGPRSNCWMFATPHTNISSVTIAPHEKPN
jgi:hypothetical protein